MHGFSNACGESDTARQIIKGICERWGFMQMPESSLNISTLIRHLLKVICGFETSFILRFISQITLSLHYF
jgi:hypothetical protein